MMDRPKQIVWFERIMFGTLALGIVNSWRRWPELKALSEGSSYFFLEQLITVISMAALYLWISRGRSNVGKWILIVFFVLGIPVVFWAQTATGISLIDWIFLIQTLANLVALALLFTRDARAWFRGEWRYAGVFD
jgi:hypothetical protein